MTDTTITELRNIDPDEISEVLVKVEKSFGFKFGGSELNGVATFGELCDLIINKVNGDDVSDCTTQQAFYKLRNAISSTLEKEKNSITADSYLLKLFPRLKRKQHIAAVEGKLGLKIEVLRPKHWVTNTFVLILLVSVIGRFIIWKIGLGGLLFSIFGLAFANKFGKEMDLQTVGQLAKKIARENYLEARRNSSTINKNEIVREVKELFSKDLVINESLLRREATFD